MDQSDDPYKILGVATDATATDIKKAFRKLALKHHPDKQGPDADKEQANAMFAKISNAYEILSDEDQRKQYDWQAGRSPSGKTPKGKSKGTGNSKSKPSTGTSKYYSNDGDFTRTSFRDPFSVFAEVFDEEFGDASPADNKKKKSTTNDEAPLPPGAVEISMQMASKMIGGKSVTVTERTYQLPDGTTTTRVDKEVKGKTKTKSAAPKSPRKTQTFSQNVASPQRKPKPPKPVRSPTRKKTTPAFQPGVTVEIIDGMKHTTTTNSDGSSSTTIEPAKKKKTSSSPMRQQPTTPTRIRKPSANNRSNNSNSNDVSFTSPTTRKTKKKDRPLTNGMSTPFSSPVGGVGKQSMSSSTKIVNGKKHTTITTTTQKADGSMETRTETKIESM